MSGILTLVPTPIADDLDFHPHTIEVLQKAYDQNAIILVEEHKVARRKWLKNGLPREAIDSFKVFNEHNDQDSEQEILKALKQGRSVYLMSDCGLPAFCDPGTQLISLCHENKIKVTSLPFENSIALALALSGFDHRRFVFEGFLAREDRVRELKRIIKQPATVVLMDTPYRLAKLLKELEEINCPRQIFVAIDLNSKTELLCRGNIKQVVQSLNGVNKREFVIILDANG